VLTEACKRDRVDAVIFNVFIKFASAAEDFDEANAAFSGAWQRNCVNLSTYSIFIQAAGKARKFRIAYNVFREACLADRVDAFTYAVFIDTAGRFCAFKEAHEAFEEAYKKKIVNNMICCSFIQAATKSCNFKGAKRGFEAGRHAPNSDLYVYFIHAAGQAGQFEEAHYAFEEARKREFVTPAIFNSFIEAAKLCNRTDVVALITC
jgi:pentatricopeptide repeat protein